MILYGSMRVIFGKHIEAKVLPRMQMVWDSIPMQLAKENKNFLGQIKKATEAKNLK